LFPILNRTDKIVICIFFIHNRIHFSVLNVRNHKNVWVCLQTNKSQSALYAIQRNSFRAINTSGESERHVHKKYIHFSLCGDFYLLQLKYVQKHNYTLSISVLSKFIDVTRTTFNFVPKQVFTRFYCFILLHFKTWDCFKFNLKQ